MFKLLKYFKSKNWIFLAISIGFIVCQVWLDLKMPEYMTVITQIAQGGEAFGNMSDIWVNGGYMLVCALGSMACSIITGFLIASIGADFSARLRDAFYRQVQSFSSAEINRFSNASLITRSTNDVQQVQMFLTIGLQMLIKAPITAVWAIVKIAGKQWQWSAATAVAVIVILLCIAIIMLLVTKKFRKMQRLTDDLNGVTRENLTGIRVIRAYNAENYQQNKFEKVNEEYTETNLFTGRTLAVMSPVMSGVMNFLSLAIYWIGAAIINASDLSSTADLFSDMVVFISYGVQVVMAFVMLTMVFMVAPRAFVSANRINEVLHTKQSLSEGGGVSETAEKGTIEFKNVFFRYPDAGNDVLSDISFRAESGQTLAFIGGTGCGKSSVVNLISRFYDATEGQVLVDGYDVKEYKKDQLNKKLGYVSQKAMLFSGSIRENVNFGDNDADEEEVKKAVKIAQSTSFVEAQTDSYDGHVAQYGSNFSGGQKQRLSIARAIARDAEIYIFDDTFSALDYRTDKMLRSAIKKEKGDSTMLIVAQRIGTIKDADKIIVLEDGKIVGQGTHSELLKTCSTYMEIARSQLSEEELQNA